MNMIRAMVSPLLLFAFFTLAWPAYAQQQEPDRLPDSAVVAERGGETLTVGDLRARIRLSLTKDRRAGFFADGERVGNLVEDQLRTRQLAAAAIKNGLDKDPNLQAEIESYIRGVYARRQIEHYLDGLELPDSSLLARERYIANRAQFIVPESRDVRHILILTTDKSEKEAKDKAEKAYGLLMNGDDFDTILDEYTEDPAISHNGWIRGVRDDGSFAPEFTAAAFALEAPGDISPPIKTEFGYHVIRLARVTAERQRSYEEVKEELIAAIQQEQRQAARESYLETFTTLPVHLNEETMLKLPSVEP